MLALIFNRGGSLGFFVGLLACGYLGRFDGVTPIAAPVRHDFHFAIFTPYTLPFLDVRVLAFPCGESPSPQSNHRLHANGYGLVIRGLHRVVWFGFWPAVSRTLSIS